MPLERLGPYKIEKLLGRGGMGAVYVGLNEQTGERAAVKVLSGHLADDSNFRERSKQEIGTLCIDQLPDDYRTVLLLRDIQALDTAAFAELLLSRDW